MISCVAIRLVGLLLLVLAMVPAGVVALLRLGSEF
jgi:hypothetical protein